MPRKAKETTEASQRPIGAHVRRAAGVVVPLAVFLALAAVTATLFIQFLGNRPLNLRPHSNRVAQDIQQLLLNNNVPQDHIAIAAAEPRQVEGGNWNYHRFQVTVPTNINIAGLEEVIRRFAAQQYAGAVSVAETESNRLQLAFGDWIFADIDFTPAAPPPRKDLTAATDRLAEDVGKVLLESGLAQDQIAWIPSPPREDEEAQWHTARVRLTLAPDADVESISKQIEERMAGRDVTIRLETSDHGDYLIRLAFAGKDAVDIVVTRAGDQVLVSELPPLDALPKESAEYLNGDAPELLPDAIGEVTQPRIAVILDDGGYGGDATEAALALQYPVTFALLPDTPNVTDTAQRAADLGFELMLHMPMSASAENAVPYPGELTIGMDADVIKQITRDAIAQVPGLAGVNNHTGSGFTTHADGMKPFLEVVKAEGLYFVDSFTTPTSVGLDLALEMQIPALRRDIFLDNEPEPEAIAAQMDKLIDRARKVGFAIGIAHFRDTTLDVLPGLLQRAVDEKVQLVYVSELMP
ncbi:MAG: divergent polysaccharide deacetylase family protein [Candidatus Hydrogenedentes bacterium]|nr:divergent polysaccharide deacetylase family protein [Candidatus Hydrogenedentota bacterium]